VLAFGDSRDASNFAKRLGIASRTWLHHEEGRSIPGEVILRLIELTNVEPIWLLYGTGPKYRVDERTPADPWAAAAGLIHVALERLGPEPVSSLCPASPPKQGRPIRGSEYPLARVLPAL
jgi:hypothetical protein